jgi:hypothetical protein
MLKNTATARRAQNSGANIEYAQHVYLTEPISMRGRARCYLYRYIIPQEFPAESLQMSYCFFAAARKQRDQRDQVSPERELPGVRVSRQSGWRERSKVCIAMDRVQAELLVIANELLLFCRCTRTRSSATE